MALAHRPLTEALAAAAYHAEQLALALDRINPDDADGICATENQPTAQALTEALLDVTEHPALAFLP
jgi:hypothetical protein